MIRRRYALSLVACIVAVAVLGGHVALAVETSHARCAAAAHHCDATTVIAACCCDTDAPRQAGPIVTAIRIAPPAQADAVPPYHPAPVALTRLRVSGAPLAAPPADIPILLSNLRE